MALHKSGSLKHCVEQAEVQIAKRFMFIVKKIFRLGTEEMLCGLKQFCKSRAQILEALQLDTVLQRMVMLGLLIIYL